MLEVNRRWSPYGYVKNSAINTVDVDGMIDPNDFVNSSQTADAIHDRKMAAKEEQSEELAAGVASRLGLVWNAGEGEGGSVPPDWVMDKHNNPYWDSKVKSAADVKAGETYLGQTAEYVSKNGNYVHLWADASFSLSPMMNVGDPSTVFRGFAFSEASMNGLADYVEATTYLLGFGVGLGESAGNFAIRSASRIKSFVPSVLKQTEQYALRALEDGFYPVMKRGFANARELTWLNKGDVWKFGTTKNPLTRYSQTWLREMNLRYFTEFEGTLKEALQLERMKIVNFIEQTGVLPAGNKIIR